MKSKKPIHEVKTLVYPVPLSTYALGVHSTVTPDGYVKIGPSARPAFGNENYEIFKGMTL